MHKYELKEILENNVATVIFTKVNGEERTMNCTLLTEYIPTQQEKQLLTESVSPVKKENDNVLSVWDTDVNAWRSFRVDSIKSFSVK